ncbi:mannitol dehydrogenase family protein [Paraburkholderia sp. CNPSo 3272]|uniref:mannitol dehydrogenase family protein n=1 Tax=Paraburkholderia sp. CNPSo 3272 TaxID=2940931 RepID=UPI0020B81971|nr:mannitol dehydrogenase family protein [Paraburkholderia sp. CNPSo 3272]MCP3723967.1 mannitol dehydrogenase family protein [Paraburkholderia sp. CNPSo 3272]
MSEPILQFGTSRFLLAHVALFVSQALERGDAIGGISVVQTTGNPVSHARVAALSRPGGYPVRIRGMEHGAAVDKVVVCDGIRSAWIADRDWTMVRRAAIEDVRVIVSNTGDTGYRLDERDSPDLLSSGEAVPRSYPAKLLSLLHSRWQERPSDGLSIFPCELLENNGDTLREIVLAMATQWSLPEPFMDYVRERCVWVNSLVDRIVSEPIDPVGAVAEPYALWAIERRTGMELPCTHENIVLTDDLRGHERLKLFFLNLGHSWLAEQWLIEQRQLSETVLDAMKDPRTRAEIETVWREEVMPVFEATGMGAQAEDYLTSVRERFCNPYLDHRIADIAQNHVAKMKRRILPLIDLANSLSMRNAQPRLRGLLTRHGLI